MASLEQCRAAAEQLAARLRGDPATDKEPPDPDLIAAARVDRTLSCRLTDLGGFLSARLRDGALENITARAGEPPNPRADIRLAMTGDDLLRLADGSLALAAAMASGRVRVNASFKDLLRLRTLL
ncbi:hypothetical protein BIV57_22605 [Mangrovactinospora gilvigrisea]|uniref:SCP2 domain-containing protein n=1 Tax=Mangrovactinospora gilvigrisea TaxID=1428644 RepID=A0A1J7C100_9ACTN|nr:SCP2 sterol-binding domain-containing protein [Mangrovactinospora gilvigrisea]OIV35244.1 hypothetical protein BIV57_22605 [Mangrovactinospora gilvigrisea]